VIIALGLCLDHRRQINHLPSGRGFGEGQVREVRNQDASQMPLAKDGDVIEAVAPDGADEPLRERILPRRLRRRENFADAQAVPSKKSSVAINLRSAD
jgi:hypothetical protein